jgi:hypothetical protein
MKDLEHVSREVAKNCVGEGWASLIDEAYDIIDAFNKKVHSIDVLQVKEKFGTLRIYVRNRVKVTEHSVTNMIEPELFEDIWVRIHEIEIRSAKTCEGCGDSSTIRDVRGWYKSLCDACLIKNLED